MVEWALDGSSAQQCLKKSAQAYLDQVFTIIANELAHASPVKVIRHTDALERVPSDQRWRDAVAFVTAIWNE
jgi:predicted Zn-dependent protease